MDVSTPVSDAPTVPTDVVAAALARAADALVERGEEAGERCAAFAPLLTVLMAAKAMPRAKAGGAHVPIFVEEPTHKERCAVRVQGRLGPARIWPSAGAILGDVRLGWQDTHRLV